MRPPVAVALLVTASLAGCVEESSMLLADRTDANSVDVYISTGEASRGGTETLDLVKHWGEFQVQ